MSPDDADKKEQPGLDWYTSRQGGVEQGDIVFDLPLILASSDDHGEYLTDDEGNFRFPMRTSRVIVLTQTCDIAKKAQKSILVAEVHSYDTLTANGQNSHLRKSDYKQSLARGTTVSDFLLPPSPDGEIPWSIVSFRNVYVVPKQVVLRQSAVGKTVGVMSPYREYLSQAFARFIMRVGLPTTLEAFEHHG